MTLKLFDSRAGNKYQAYIAAETQEQANKLAQIKTGVNYLNFTSKEVTIPGYILTIRGESDDVGTNEAENGRLDSPEKPEQPGAEPKPAAAEVKPAAKPPVVRSGSQKAAGRSKTQGRRGK